MKALAVTDHGNMFGAVAFHDAARAEGPQAHPGLRDLRGPGQPPREDRRRDRRGLQPHDAAGRGRGRLPQPREARLHRLHRGLLPPARASTRRSWPAQPGAHRPLRLPVRARSPPTSATGRRRRPCSPSACSATSSGRTASTSRSWTTASRTSAGSTRGCIRLHGRTGLPLVATNDAHYLPQGRPPGPRRAGLHRLGQEGPRGPTGSASTPRSSTSRAADEMARCSPTGRRPWPTRSTSPRCASSSSRGRTRCPPSRCRPASRSRATSRRSPATASRSGGKPSSRWPRPAACATRCRDYEERLDKEIGVIRRVGFAGYFLIVWDFIRYARRAEASRWGPGRGSAAGSLVAYSLRITDIDPIEYDLIFERFLNEERISPPDIDIDFCENRRGEVIEYVTRKYGRENVAQIITFGTMKAKAVVRDVGRVLDMSYADVDRIAKMIPFDLKMTLDKALAESPPLKEAYQKDPRVKELIDISQAPGGHHPPRVHPRRGGRDRAPAADGVRAPGLLQGRHRGRPHHPVRHEGRGAHRPPQDGLPGPAHADPHRQLREDDRGPDGHAHRPGPAAPRRRADLRAVHRAARPAACSSSSRTACATS